MQKVCRPTTAEDIASPLLQTPARHEVTVDVARYQALLDDMDVSPESKEAMIRALWTIIVYLVELGFNISSLEEADRIGECATSRPGADQTPNHDIRRGAI